MGENIEPYFVKNNEDPQLFAEKLSDIKDYKFNKLKSYIREDNEQDLIDGINIINRRTINEVSYLMNNSSSVKLYSSKAYENTSKTFCERLLKMGIDASFYDINERKNTETICLNDLAIVNTFKSKKDLCDKILAVARKKYAKTVSINKEERTSNNADYEINTFKLKEKNDSRVVKSVLDCLSFAAFSNKMTSHSSQNKSCKSSTFLN